MTERTQVGIIGAGPAGLVLSLLLAEAGIESVVLEGRARDTIESEVRAGVLEEGTVAVLDRLGVADRLHRDGLVHGGLNLQFEGRRHRIDLHGLTGGGTITVYGQQEVLKDLIAARLARGGDLRFGNRALTVEAINGREPTIRHGSGEELRCDVVVGCDGFHGVSRAAIPAAALRTYERSYPYGWLGILAAVAPSSDELVYAYHRRGFALHSMRSPTLSRLYLQVDPADDLANWPDERIWSELQVRLGSPGWTLHEGPIVEKGISLMRSFVAEPLRHGRLFLAGDAAHIVPPTGAKGLNLAVADVTVLARALVDWYRSGDTTGLATYSDRCLDRVWRVQAFSTTMTALLHVDPGEDGFGHQLQRARQRDILASTAVTAALARNYVGLPLD